MESLVMVSAMTEGGGSAKGRTVWERKREREEEFLTVRSASFLQRLF
jgi:hypothetical protein